MKHKLKKIIVLFLLTGILFVSCELQEDYHSKKEYEGKMKISHKNFSELLNDRKFNKAYGEVLDKKNKMSRTVMEEQYQFTIANGLANVIETDSEITYTLLIKRDSIEENTVENLVVKIDSLNETTAYIVKFKGKQGVIPTNDNLNDDNIEKVITPIVYNSNIASKEIYECYKISYWVCYYPGHTETGVCTHGQYETMEFCVVVGYDIGGDDVISVGGADGGGGGGGSSSTGSDYDGSDGSIHGNGGATELDMAPILELDEIPLDPCDKIKKLQADNNFKNRMALLIDAARGWRFENCFVMYNNSVPSTTNNYTYENFRGSANSPESGYTGNTNMQGVIHSHYNGLISIFSAGDLYDMYIKLKNYPDITDDFFLGVVTSSNTAYLLQVPDRAAFIAFGDKYLANDEKLKDFMTEKMLKKYNIHPENSNSANELGFLKMMKNLNMGLSIASVDFNASTPATGDVFNTWTKKEYDNQTRTVITSNCN